MRTLWWVGLARLQPALVRHSGECLCAVISGEGLSAVIPAKAGIHFDFVFDAAR